MAKEFDGQRQYKNCEKKAAVIREKDNHKMWYSSHFKFLFSKDSKYYLDGNSVNLIDLPQNKYNQVKAEISYSRALDPDYGYVR